MLWGVLAIVAAIARAWSATGMALLFTTGFLAQELRAWQHMVPRAAKPKLVMFSLVSAALGTAGIYLILRYQFHVGIAVWGVALLFTGFFLLYAAGSWVARLLRGRLAPANDRQA